jgi:hypothetical protein
MSYWLGTDEAGYGPNLGPLVVSTTVWRLPDDGGGDDLYARLADAVVTRPGDAKGPRVAIADSKTLYSSDKGLRHLERGLLAALRVLGRKTDCSDAIWAALDPQHDAVRRAVPWQADHVETLPIDAKADEIEAAGDNLRKTLDAAGVELIDIRSRAVFPEEFNRLIDRFASKGVALSILTLDLLAEAMRPLGDEPIRVTCDKHGGRNRYAALLARCLSTGLIETGVESRDRSVYRFGPSERRVEITFQTRAETLVPAALASMASKYLRELAMRAFNDFWGRRVEGLQPTAGYPQDAKRFKSDIAAVQARLGIDADVLWRNV